jgi:aspartokinase-like uncharacterized kinase
MSLNPHPVCVVKLGGSLLDFEQLPVRLESWLSRHRDSKMVFVVGGGYRVEQVRDWEQRFEICPGDSHWHSIEMMQLNSLAVASWFSDWVWTDDLDNVVEAESAKPVIFAVKHWLLSLDDRLPETWDVTSDSIAATVACEITADQLVLLKSADPPAGASLESLTESGYVDKYFQHAAKELSIRLVNLRDPEMPECIF